MECIQCGKKSGAKLCLCQVCGIRMYKEAWDKEKLILEHLYEIGGDIYGDK